jgi:lipopolysaccharide transport system ATP-binding protein
VDEVGRPIVHAWTCSKEIAFCQAKGKYTVICTLPNLRLYMGTYTIKVYFTEFQGGRVFDVVEGVCRFDVTMMGKERGYEWKAQACTYLEDTVWKVT